MARMTREEFAKMTAEQLFIRIVVGKFKQRHGIILEDDSIDFRPSVRVFIYSQIKPDDGYSSNLCEFYFNFPIYAVDRHEFLRPTQTWRNLNNWEQILHVLSLYDYDFLQKKQIVVCKRLKNKALPLDSKSLGLWEIYSRIQIQLADMAYNEEIKIIFNRFNAFYTDYKKMLAALGIKLY